ncbi:MAG TPA: Gfo/Idh/MocA family oxidoreductase [Candidatus Limnocylindrales bacterium]|nr:Gfo/Idh/MocA family oxidoreductase [Candidatus Limnocylindrales bacterium]
MTAARRSDPTGGHRLGLIGAGWISGYHLAALDRLGRTQLVAVTAASRASAEAVAAPAGAAAYPGTDLERMLDEQRPEVAIVAVPPWAAVATLERLVERDIPFLTEKPLAATDAAGPARLAAAIEARSLVAAVGYHLRGLEALAEVRSSLATNPAHLVSARWLGSTPPPVWWRTEATGGGQVIEQATHFYDLARLLAGEATVLGAASTRALPFVPEGVDLADATAALLRFDSGALGSFANSRRLASSVIELSLACADRLITIRKLEPLQTSWQVTIDDGGPVRTLAPGRDPYEVQAEAFLAAVEARDPSRVLSTYADALRTDTLTRAVVAATGRSG